MRPIILDAMSSNQGLIEDSATDHLPMERRTVIMIQTLRQQFDMEIYSIQAARIQRWNPMIYAPLMVAMNNLNVVELLVPAAHIGDRILNDCRRHSPTILSI
jgi:hypothetical protein